MFKLSWRLGNISDLSKKQISDVTFFGCSDVISFFRKSPSLDKIFIWNISSAFWWNVFTTFLNLNLNYVKVQATYWFILKKNDFFLAKIYLSMRKVNFRGLCYQLVYVPTLVKNVPTFDENMYTLVLNVPIY